MYSGVIRYSSWYFTHTNIPLIYPFSAVAIPSQALRKHVGIMVIRWGRFPWEKSGVGGVSRPAHCHARMHPSPGVRQPVS